MKEKIYPLTEDSYNSDSWISVLDEWIVFKDLKKFSTSQISKDWTRILHVHLEEDPVSSMYKRFHNVNEKTLKCKACGKESLFNYDQLLFLAKLEKIF